MLAYWHDRKHLDRPTAELGKNSGTRESGFKAQEPRRALVSEIPDIPDELAHIPTVGNAMGQPGLRWAIDDVLNRMRQDHADTDD